MNVADFSAAHWQKSSYSTDAGNCVEVATALTWRTSSYSTDASNCVEVAAGDKLIGVRDSKNPTGGHLVFPAPQWRAFVEAT